VTVSDQYLQHYFGDDVLSIFPGLQEVPEKMVIAEPVPFSVQGDYKKVLLLELAQTSFRGLSCKLNRF
jgi:hypothetical protein